MGFPGTGKIWMNGKLVEWKDATIHIGSHVIHYGSGVFEGARCYTTPKGSACFRLDDHLIRLINSAKIYRMEYPLDLAGWRNAVLETIRANQMKACYIRPLIYRGYDTLGVNPLPNPVDAAIMLWEWGAYLGTEALEHGVDMKVSSWARLAPTRCPRWPRVRPTTPTQRSSRWRRWPTATRRPSRWTWRGTSARAAADRKSVV